MRARIGQSETVWTWLLWPSSWFIMRTGQSERDCCSHHSSRQRAGRRAEHQDSDSAATWIPARVEPAQAERSRPRPAQAEGLLICRDLASGPLRLKGSWLARTYLPASSGWRALDWPGLKFRPAQAEGLRALDWPGLRLNCKWQLWHAGCEDVLKKLWDTMITVNWIANGNYGMQVVRTPVFNADKGKITYFLQQEDVRTCKHASFYAPIGFTLLAFVPSCFGSFSLTGTRIFVAKIFDKELDFQ